MSVSNIPVYTPAEPTPGLTIINIVTAEEKADITCIYYDIAIGPSAGYAATKYQQTGRWLLDWFISGNPNAEVVYKHALEAVQYVDPGIRSLADVQNIPIAAELGYDERGHIRVCRSFPFDTCYIPPSAIKLGTSSWAKGSPDFVRATLISKNSGLPILLADTHEKDSPMVDWCAENGIVIQPMLFPFGDYQLPGHNTVVDRKANLLELYENFVHPDKRCPYENDAILAAAHGSELVYVTATAPEDNVRTLKDLRNWSAKIPGKSEIADGEKLLNHLVRYKKYFPHTDFTFCPKNKLCERIFNTLSF